MVNRLTKITDSAKLAVSYVYDATSKLTSKTLPNSVATTYTYDGLDRLTRLKDAKGNTVIADNQYSYSNAGDITQNIDQSGTHGYGYDTIDRVISATYPATTNETYAYDGVGNRTSSHKSATYAYQPNNRLVSTSTASYIYNNNGNMISKTEGTGTTQYAWDFENRLTQVVTPSSGSVTYKYDALGRRIQRTPSSGISTNFVYDGQDVIKDVNSDGSTVEYLNGPGIDNKIRQKGSSTSTTYYFSQDHLGSTTALTGTTGKLIERITYDGYGNSTGSTRTRYGFTGRERDPLTGIIYYRARFYDPQLGRFISEDPIDLRGGINLYTYVSNDPVNSNDPLGLFTVRDGITKRRAVDVDPQCGSRNAGACTTHVQALVVCTCKCDGADWKASAELRIYGQMWITTLPFPYKRRRPVDRTVVNAETAIAHEYNAHINPAIAAVTPLINALETKTFKSKEECYGGCNKTSSQVSDRFRQTLRQTQEQENRQ